MIEIRDLTVAFGGVRPLQDLTVTLDGHIVGVVGPNGAGKTTLLNVISGFVTPVSGSVVIDGQDILSLAPYARARWGVRRTFQTEQVVDELSVRDNIRVILDAAGRRGDAAAAVDRAIELVGLEGAVDRPTAQLNAFERRLVELGRAVAGEPRVVMLDEPAAGLSEQETGQLRATLQRVAGDAGIQLVLIDHDVDLIAALCDTTAVLDFGRLIAYAPTAEALDDPVVKDAYLGVADSVGEPANGVGPGPGIGSGGSDG